MTRKHFEIIARLLAEYRQDAHHADTIDDIAGDLAVVFKDLNPRFDTVRFIEATKQEV
jgi:hypothetical protein